MLDEEVKPSCTSNGFELGDTKSSQSNLIKG